MRRCKTCMAEIPPHDGPGRPRDVCRNDHCEAVHYSGQARKKCGRCGSRLAKGRAAQRMGICMRCIVNIVDIIGLERLSHHRPN